MDVYAARALFSGLRDRVFLDAACVSLLPDPAAEALARLTRDLGTCPARDAACLQHLLARHILISQRYTAGVGGLRVSLHYFNDLDDVGRLVSEVAASRRTSS